MIPKSISNRLAALESARQHTEISAPVDMDAVMRKMELLLAAFRHGHKQPDESVLTAYARGFKYRDEAELLRVALNDGAEFERRHVGRDAAGVRQAVIERFLTEETVHQLVDVLFPWWTERPSLADARPCRPAEPATDDDVDDEAVSEIGRNLLVLAERRPA
jgi:hypothetical protein